MRNPHVAEPLRSIVNEVSPKVPDVAHILRKIQEAAYDGQNGSANYAFDRLCLIQSICTTILRRLESGS